MYTAYPYEEEILLSEGCPALILGIERNVELLNPPILFSDYQGRELTIIHMYLPDYYVDRVKAHFI